MKGSTTSRIETSNVSLPGRRLKQTGIDRFFARAICSQRADVSGEAKEESGLSSVASNDVIDNIYETSAQSIKTSSCCRSSKTMSSDQSDYSDKQCRDEVNEEERSSTGSNKDSSNGESDNEKAGKSKKLLKKRERNNKRGKKRSVHRQGSSSIRSPEATERMAPVTSTPVKIKCLNIKAKRRESKRGKFVKKRSIQVAKKILEEAAMIDLSSSTDMNENLPGGSEECNAEFESMSSGVRSEIMRMMSDISVNNQSNGLESSQDPQVEEVILGLITPDETYNNPFQVAENIRRELVRQAEESGRRALEWNLNTFDTVG